MNIGLYYQILDMGVLYEKAGRRGTWWRIGERKRLKDEIWFWQTLLENISREQNGISCGEVLFAALADLCGKYRLPHYKRVLDNKEELINCSCIFERDGEEESKLRNFMECLLRDAQEYLDKHRDKEMVYRILMVLHNLPRAMYGKNVLNPNAIPISYRMALEYAKGCMDEEMREKYGKYLV